MERREIRDLIREASDFFEGNPDPVKSAYVITPDGSKGVSVELPSFWSESLSRAFADVELLEGEEEEKISRKEREVLENILEIEEAGDYNKDMGWKFERIEGLSGGMIAKLLSEGLITRGFTSRNDKRFYGNVEKIEKKLGTEG